MVESVVSVFYHRNFLHLRSEYEGKDLKEHYLIGIGGDIGLKKMVLKKNVTPQEKSKTYLTELKEMCKYFLANVVVF